MALNLNTSPYFDDFDAEKNYNRILFKPGVAVQARELTQLQTALQHQISSLGSFTLKNGAIISGCEEVITPVHYIKLTDEYYPNGTSTTTSLTNSALADFKGMTLEGVTSGIKARILSSVQGSVAERPALKAFYIDYIDYNGVAPANAHFTAGERLKIVSQGSELNTEFVASSLVSSPVTLSDNYYGTTYKIQLGPGVIYVKDQFVVTDTISTFVHPFSTSVRRKIGFQVTESIKSYTDDNTLLDPASGSYNFNAPGADRYNLSVTLKSIALSAEDPELFFECGRFEYGDFRTGEVRSDQLNELGKIINERAYMTSGNYVDRGFNVKVREHLRDANNGGAFLSADGGDANKFVVEVSPGYAQVNGSPLNMARTRFIELDKPTATVTKEDQTITTNYGNYLTVNEVCGSWDIQGSTTVDLYDTAQTAITSATFSSTTASGNKIGEARVKHFVHDTGTAGAADCKYRLYLYDVKMTSGSFASVKSIYHNDATADAFADVVLSNTDANASAWSTSKYFAPNQLVYNGDYLYTATIAGTSASSGSGPTHTSGTATDGTITWQYAGTANYGAKVEENFFNTSLFRLPANYMKTIAVGGTYDYDFQYTKELTATVSAVNGSFTVSLTGNETFPYSAGALSDTTILANIQVVAEDSFATTVPTDTISLGEVIDLTAAGRSVSLDALQTTLTIDLGATAVATSGLDVRVFANVQVQDSTPVTKSLSTDQYVSILADGTDVYATSDSVFSLGVADVLRVTEIRAHSSAFSTGSEGTDVTSQFTFVNGQKDNYYGLASIVKKASATVDFSTTPYLLVKFDYFIPSTTGPSFATVDSYATPISGGSMTIQEIPLYVDGNKMVKDLRNYIDFRPYATNTATPTGTVASATQNPSSVVSSFTSSTLTQPVPVQEFTTDYEFYLGQGFRVIISAAGKVEVLFDEPSLNPSVPLVSNDRDMTLATFVLKPYPSLGNIAAKYYKRLDLASKVISQDNPKFTMRQIGSLEKRIANLEYYTALSILEQSSKDEKFLDSSGVDRFKNGLLVDSFNDFSTAGVMNSDYKCSFSKATGTMRSFYSDEFIEVDPNFTGASDECGQTGRHVHVPFAEVVYTQNLQATKWESIVTELLYDDSLPPCPAGYYYDTNLGVCTQLYVKPVDEGTKRPITPTKVYDCTSLDTAVDEGGTISVRVDTVGVDEGVTVTYRLEGSSGSGYTLVSGDLASGSKVGTVTIDEGGQGKVTWTFATETGITADTELTFELALTDSDGDSTGGTSDRTCSFTLNNTNSGGVTCVLPYVKNAAGTACVPPKCNTGYEWDTATKSCKFVEPKKPGSYYGTLSLTPNTVPAWTDTRTDNPDIVESTAKGNVEQFVYNNDGWHLDYDRIIQNAEYSVHVEEVAYATGKTDKINIQPGGTEPIYNEVYNSYGSVAPVGYVTWAETYDEITYDLYARNKIAKTPQINEWAETYSGALPQNKVTVVGEKEISSEATGYVRPTVVNVQADGLAPNLEHSIYVNGIKKKTVTTTAGGRFNQDYNIGEKELPVGTHEVKIAASENGKVSGTISQATAYFTGGEHTIVQKANRVTVLTPPRTRSGTKTTNPSPTPMDPVRVTTHENLGVQGDIEYCYFAQGCPSGSSSHSSNPPANVTTTQPTIVQALPGSSSVIVVGDGSKADAVVQTTLTQTFNPQTGANWGEDLTEGFATFDTSHLAGNNNASVTSSNNYPTVTTTTIADNVEYDYDLTNEPWEYEVSKLMRYMVGNPYGECAGGFDPMAQSFIVDDLEHGVFISSVDVFFHTVSKPENNNGIVLELRNMVNGYPGPEVLAKCKKYAADCFGSVDDGDGTFTPKGTNFKFDYPVFLEAGEEYCIVPIPDRDDPDYKVWIAELGEPQHGGTTVVSKQPHAGILFTSANNRTWTPRQKEDMMFRINRCTFAPNTTYKAKWRGKDHDWTNFTSFSDSSTKFDIGDFVHGFTFTIGNSGGAGYSAAPDITITDSTGKGTGATATSTIDSSGSITAITLTDPGTGFAPNSNITVTIDVGSNPAPSAAATVEAQLNIGRVIYHAGIYDETSTVQVLGGYFTSTNTVANPAATLVGNGTKTATVDNIFDRVVSSYHLRCPVDNPGGRGTVIPKFALTNTGAASVNTTHTDMRMGKLTDLDTEKTVYSYSNEQANYSGAKSCTFEINLKTTAEHLSPMLNMDMVMFNAFKNEINNDSSGEETRIGGTADTRYISRIVRLEDGQDAEDIITILDNYVPSTGSVKVYYKIQHADDEGIRFEEDLIWREMSQTAAPSSPLAGFGEYKYGLPAKGSNSYGLNSEGVVEYDVTGIATIPVSSGGSGYTGTPTVNITHSGDGFGAKATATVTAGAVTAITVTDPGRGYDGGTITVTLTGGSPSSAATVGTPTTQSTTYEGFKYYAIKIVHLNSTTVNIPKSRKLRAYALQV